jgi:hypothetical protein
VEIKVQMSSDSIWGSDPYATAGLDVAASEAKLLEMVRTQVQIDYPNAAVDVELTSHDGVTVNWRLHHRDTTALDAEAVEETIHQVWEARKWTIARIVRVGDRVEEKSKCGCQAVWRVACITDDIAHLYCVTALTCPACTERDRVFCHYGWTCRMPLYEIKPTDAGDAEWRML